MYVSVSVCLCLCVSVFVFVCLCVCLFVSVWPSLSLQTYMYCMQDMDTVSQFCELYILATCVLLLTLSDNVL